MLSDTVSSLIFVHKKLQPLPADARASHPSTLSVQLQVLPSLDPLQDPRRPRSLEATDLQ